MPISTSVRKCASNFRKTHQDTWHEDSKRFTEEQHAALSSLLSGSSYCVYPLYGFRSQLIEFSRCLIGRKRFMLQNWTMPEQLIVHGGAMNENLDILMLNMS